MKRRNVRGRGYAPDGTPSFPQQPSLPALQRHFTIERSSMAASPEPGCGRCQKLAGNPAFRLSIGSASCRSARAPPSRPHLEILPLVLSFRQLPLSRAVFTMGVEQPRPIRGRGARATVARRRQTSLYTHWETGLAGQSCGPRFPACGWRRRVSRRASHRERRVPGGGRGSTGPQNATPCGDRSGGDYVVWASRPALPSQDSMRHGRWRM
jgi:hypothetical protein